MDLLDLANLLELDADVRSPATPVKLMTVGKVIGLNEDSRVIDFGCAAERRWPCGPRPSASGE